MAISMDGVYLSVTGFMLFLAVVTFIATMVKVNPYGRHMEGVQIRTLPSRMAWLIFESPQWFAFALTFFWLVNDPSFTQLVLFGLWQAHYTYRAIVYPLRMRGHDKGFPLSGVIFGFIFNCLNGFINAYAVVYAPYLINAWATDPRFILGLLMACTGWIINFESDSILIKLRGDGSTGYKIPRGGMFNQVSAANYFGEIVMWCGWALMTCTAAGIVFALFTVANLMPRALSHHRWYRETFPDYPKDRKALIPYLL